jgi:O-antigen/teichoic acid export membrane protein
MLVVARRVGAPMYGVIGVATAVVLYLNRVVDGGIELGLGVREIARDPRLDHVLPSILTARIVTASVLVLLVSVVGLGVLPQPDGVTLSVMALTLLAVGGGARWAHIGLNQSKNAAGAMLVGQAVAAGLMIGLVQGPGDVALVPAFLLVGEGLAAILLLWWLGPQARRLPVQIRKDVIQPLVPRAGALVLSALLGIVIYNASFIFLRIMQGPAAVGYYNAAYTLVTFFLNVGTAYSLTLLPQLTRLHQVRTEQVRLYHDAMAHVFAAGLPVALGGSLLAGPIIGLLYGPAYAPASGPFLLLVWSIPLCLLRDVPLMALQAAGREGKILRVTLLAAVLNLGLNAVLIPRWGIAGAAVATLVTEGTRMGLALTFVAREGYGLAWLLRFWRPLVAGAAMGAVLVWGGLSLPVAIPAGALLYGIALTLVGGIAWRRGRLPVLTV